MGLNAVLGPWDSVSRRSRMIGDVGAGEIISDDRRGGFGSDPGSGSVKSIKGEKWDPFVRA